MKRTPGLLLAVVYAMACIALGILFTPANAASSAAYPYPSPSPTTVAYGPPASRGAEPYKYSFCGTYYNNFTFCENVRGVTTTTRTPSGNVKYGGNAQYSVVITDNSGKVIESYNNKWQYNSLTKDAVLQLYSYHSTYTFQYGSLSCTSSGQLHIANDKLQFSRSNFTCQ